MFSKMSNEMVSFMGNIAKLFINNVRPVVSKAFLKDKTFHYSYTDVFTLKAYW